MTAVMEQKPEGLSFETLIGGHMDLFSRILTPRMSQYIPWTPTAKQAAFLVLDQFFPEDEPSEALYGGAAFGGKTVAMLMAALQYEDVPGYTALLLRREFVDLVKGNDSLIPLSHQWLAGTDAQWNGTEHQWTFPSGAKLLFGHMKTEKDKYQYQGPSFQFVGFDELTHFSLTQYTYMFSRSRKPVCPACKNPSESDIHLPLAHIPLRMRAASNPGGDGHNWVKQRFLVEGRKERRVFIRATMADNPHGDKETYRKNLAKLDEVTRRQLQDGDWEVRHGGSLFQREWLIGQSGDLIWDHMPPPAEIVKRVRYWDLAAGTSEEAAYTVGVRADMLRDKTMVIERITRGRWAPGLRDQIIEQTAQMDGRETMIYLEQEPGSGGLAQVQSIERRLAGFPVYRDRPNGRGDKERRWTPLSSYAENGHVRLVRGPWLSDFLDELEALPSSTFKDQADAAAGALYVLTSSGEVGFF